MGQSIKGRADPYRGSGCSSHISVTGCNDNDNGDGIRAYYAGNASGFAALNFERNGNRWKRPEGSLAGVDWTGEVALEANFSNSSLRGNSTINGQVSRIKHNDLIGTLGNSASLSDYVIFLEKATMDSGGTFTGNVGLHDRSRPSGQRDSKTASGKWGGRLSTVDVRVEHGGEGPTSHGAYAPWTGTIPKAIGGTLGVSDTLPDGTAITFGGSFEGFYYSKHRW